MYDLDSNFILGASSGERETRGDGNTTGIGFKGLGFREFSGPGWGR